MSIPSSSPGANPTGHTYVDSLIWGTSWNVGTNVGGPAGTITYSFDDGSVGSRTFAPYMKAAIRKAFALIEQIIPVDFDEVSFRAPNGQVNNVNMSYALWTQKELGGTGTLGFHQVPGQTPFLDSYGIGALFGGFAYDTPLFSQEALKRGGEGFATIVHEILHGLGLAHPHDTGGQSSKFPGVSSPFNDYGHDGQNQAVYTIMSYNSGYAQKLPLLSHTYGGAGGPMALDIAALQEIYGARSHKTGDSLYKLDGINGSGTYWKAIWDTGGNDTISAEGISRNVKINLNDADLDGNNAGGTPSHAAGIRGGYTIANGVVIENAIGGKGDDILVGNEANNILEGRVGNDTISARSGNDTLYGGAGKDTLTGGFGDDVMFGGSGMDNFVLSDSDGNDTINGGAGVDWLRYNGTSAVTVDLSDTTAQSTGYGVDTITNIENVQGTAGNDQITGNASNNQLEGHAGTDTLNGQDGKDKLIGGGGNDDLIGGSGKDNLIGGDGGDTLSGDSGADVLSGGFGLDTLDGGSGEDLLKGGNGADVLIGGLGRDIMVGGNGPDTFVFNATDESAATALNADVIKDFTQGKDKIDLSAIDASTVLATDDTFVFNGTVRAGTSDEGEVFYVKKNNPGTANDKTLVLIDTDGDKAPEMIIQLDGLYDLTQDDFIL